MFGENGFIIGREAFVSTEEFQKTIFHELHRLYTSQAPLSGVGGPLAARETAAAANFANRAWQVVYGRIPR
jgi:hypothetical protein